MNVRSDIRQIFGIPKRVTSLYHRAMSETLLLFLGADVSDNYFPWGPAV